MILQILINAHNIDQNVIPAATVISLSYLAPILPVEAS